MLTVCNEGQAGKKEERDKEKKKLTSYHSNPKNRTLTIFVLRIETNLRPSLPIPPSTVTYKKSFVPLGGTPTI